MSLAALTLFPAEASNHAAEIDILFFALLAFCVLIVLVTFFLIIYFCIRYRDTKERHSEEEVIEDPSRQHRMEIGWIVAATIVFLGFFTWSAKAYYHIFEEPEDALPIHVLAKQWMWKIQHTNGRGEINELHVPLGEPVELIMSSKDVIHSFYVPAFRLKYDVVPGTYTRMNFVATQEGEFDLFCAELCGTDHSKMIGKVIVMRKPQYQEWLAGPGAESSMAEKGKQLFTALGCSGCHEPGGPIRAPELAGLFGNPVAMTAGGTKIADRQYLRDSILLPNKDVVAGFDAVMPTYQGQLEQEKVNQLVEYLVSIGNTGGNDD